MKRFGGKRTAAEFEPFELVTRDDDGTEHVHTFRARPNVSAAVLISVMDSLTANPEQSLGRMQRLITRSLDNKDGVPAQWQPTQLDTPDTNGNADPVPESYRGPDGAIHAFAEASTLEGLLAVDAGSSRRRWEALLSEDNQEIVLIEDIVEIGEWLIATAIGRPTSPRG